jgi:DNA topoisomerase-2
MSVHLTVTLTAEGKAAVRKEGVEKALKLTSSLATSNMVCFDVNGKIKKYVSPEEIINDFYDVRLSYYMKRKVRVSPVFSTRKRLLTLC